MLVKKDGFKGKVSSGTEGAEGERGESEGTHSEYHFDAREREQSEQKVRTKRRGGQIEEQGTYLRENCGFEYNARRGKEDEGKEKGRQARSRTRRGRTKERRETHLPPSNNLRILELHPFPSTSKMNALRPGTLDCHSTRSTK